MKSIAITKATAATAEVLQKEITKDGQRVDEVLDDVTTRNVDEKFKQLQKQTQKTLRREEKVHPPLLRVLAPTVETRKEEIKTRLPRRRRTETMTGRKPQNPF